MGETLFGTDGIRGTANKYPMTADLMLGLGRALADWLDGENQRKKVLVGKDTRISGYLLEYALTSGLVSRGVDVLLVGPMPTPAIAHLTKSFAADAGVVISASHNPAEDNGVKIFDRNGLKLSAEEEAKIEGMIASQGKSEGSEGARSDPITVSAMGKVRRIDDARGRYNELLKHAIANLSLKGLKIALDCANGAAYSIAPEIFTEFGAEVAVINNRPDGMNINDGAGALHPGKVSEIVRGHYADVGVSLDGDADRVIFVDENGKTVDGDAILYLVGCYLKEKGLLVKDTVVATVYSNSALDKALQKKGIRVVRVACGDRNVLEMMDANGYVFGGEESGHLIFRDYATTGDGILAALQVIRIMKETGKRLSELIASYTPAPQVVRSGRVAEKVPLEGLPGARQEITSIEKKLGCDGGRVFVRYSGTEPKVRVLVEGQGPIDEYADTILRMIQEETEGR